MGGLSSGKSHVPWMDSEGFWAGQKDKQPESGATRLEKLKLKSMDA